MTTVMVALAIVMTMIAVLAIFRGMYIILTSELTVQMDSRLLPPGLVVPQQKKAEKKFDELLERFSLTRSLDSQLEKANIKLSVREWVLIWMGIIAFGALLGYVLSHSWLGALMMGIAGFVGPRFWLMRRIEQRLRAFNDQLTEVLRMLVSSLQAGHGLLQALQLVAKELPPPASEEFDRVVREVALGYSMNEALERLAERMASDDLEMMVTAINIQSEVGGKLSDILENISETITERVRLKGEIRVMTAQQRMSGYVISGMPFILALIISVLNPDYIMELFQPGWRWLPIMAGVMMVVGQIVMQRMLQIDV